MKKLADISPGDKVKTSHGDFIVLEHRNGNTLIVLENCMEDYMEYGCLNNLFNDSVLKKIIDTEVTDQLSKVFGEKNLVREEVEIVSLDGDSVGTIDSPVRLLTFDEVRRFNHLIRKPVVGSMPFWTCTPWSKDHVQKSVVAVFPSGVITKADSSIQCGIKPCVLLKSTTLVKVVA